MRRIVLIIAGLLALAILFVPAYILWLTWSGAEGSAPDGLLTFNTKDSTRLAESSPAVLSASVAQVLFPTGSNLQPDGVILAPADNWQAAVAAAPLVRWVNGPLLLVDDPAGSAAEMDRLRPGGLEALDGAAGVAVGLDQAPAGSTQVLGDSGPEVAAAVTLAQVTFPATRHANQPGAISLARPDLKEELMTAVSIIHHPVEAPILFTDQDRLPAETRAALARFHPEGIAFDRNVQVIVVGNIAEAVTREVEDLGLKVRHIRGDQTDPASLAVAVDDYRAAIHADHPDTVVVASLDQPDFALPALSFVAHMPAGFAFVNRVKSLAGSIWASCWTVISV